MSQYILIAVAIIPAVVLCLFVYLKDRREKEPLWLLLLLLGAGAFSCLPAAALESVFQDFLDGFYFSSDAVYLFLKTFFGIALIEEGCKFFFLYLLTRKSRHFDYFFDGIVYAVFVSLGFALLENVLYATDYGMKTALLRAVTAVPGHAADGVLMGYWYATWMVNRKAAELEAAYHIDGRIDAQGYFSPRKGMLNTILIPTLAHGFYDFCCMSDKAALSSIFILFIYLLFHFCFVRIVRASKTDTLGDNKAFKMLVLKYPELAEEPVEI